MGHKYLTVYDVKMGFGVETVGSRLPRSCRDTLANPWSVDMCHVGDALAKSGLEEKLVAWTQDHVGMHFLIYTRDGNIDQ